MRGQRFVIDSVRALFEWARDGDRGGLLPDGFKNPFLRAGEKRYLLHGDPLAEPDITVPMAAAFLRTCDDYEIRMFVPLILFGLRAAEPCFLVREFLQTDWLLVPNIPELDYRTKGRRDKRFPLLASVDGYWNHLRAETIQGVLFQRRRVVDGRQPSALAKLSLAELQDLYRERLQGQQKGHEARKKLRNQLFFEAGGIDYDELKSAFHRIHKQLGWPAAATLKDFRHLFATTLANAGMPEGYRKYLLGHAPGRDAAVAYTHLNKLREHYERIVTGEYAEILAVIRERFPDHADKT
jgi:integrase